MTDADIRPVESPWPTRPATPAAPPRKQPAQDQRKDRRAPPRRRNDDNRPHIDDYA